MIFRSTFENFPFRKKSLPNADVDLVKEFLDPEFYRQQGVRGNTRALALHYVMEGWRNNLDPAPWFSSQYYLVLNPDVAKEGQNPFIHYLRFGKGENRLTPISRRAPTKLDDDLSRAIENEIDFEFYQSQFTSIDFSEVSAAAHYLAEGSRRGADPSRAFNTTDYLRLNPDVQQSGINPLVHYVLFGRDEGRVTSISAHALMGVSLEELDLLRETMDTDFYKSQFPHVDFDHIGPSEHYSVVGWQCGADPSPEFSTSGYLRLNPDVEASGVNPFVHFLLFGRDEGRITPISTLSPSVASPENLKLLEAAMDIDFYKGQFPHVDFSTTNPAEHYSVVGWKLGADPARNFSTSGYLQLHPDVEKSGINPLLHFVLVGRNEDRRTSMSTLALPVAPPEEIRLLEAAMDVGFYKSQFPQVDFDKITPAEHYAKVGWLAGANPTRHFSTFDYLDVNRDVQDARINPFVHYLERGRVENRLISRRSPASDGVSEWEGYDEVRAMSAQKLSRAYDPQLLSFCVSLLGADLNEAIQRLDFGHYTDDSDHSIEVTVIVPCLNQEAVTAECLVSLFNAKPKKFAIEVIVADNASVDPLYSALETHSSIKTIRFAENIGFGPACNEAAEQARGKYIFFLNNDAQVAPGCIERLVEAIEGETDGRRIGMVGPKLISFDGSLQEAGCILRPDGTGALIGFGDDPNAPRFNYDRVVQHVSGAAILVRRDVFMEIGGFDPIFAPAYCEDADLTLKIRGINMDVRYVSHACVVHHLSKTFENEASGSSKRQRIARNRDILVKRWGEELAKNDLRTIAFYLPQYHPIPENDAWWGKGFTEWSNVGKSKQNYVGHNQPRYPLDLGYYDLRVPEIMDQQADLARAYGISGFCYYYYWFGGKKLLEMPLERMLQTGRPDFPFCLCWANENWTRTWDGLANEVLIGQSYGDEDALAQITDIARYFSSPNYIKVNSKPILLVYRVKEISNPRRTIGIWRNYCRSIGIGEICVVSVESFELSAAPEDPALNGCDFSVEFPPHGMVTDAPVPVQKLNPEWTGAAHDYRSLCRNYITRQEPGFRRFRSVLVGWDNTPRRQNGSLVLENATPGAFQAWLEWTYLRTLEQNFGEERLVFINAWNEWCEGSYLEPDRRYGHAYLQAVKNALENVAIGGNAFVQI